jgi:hypothetical protein
MEIIKTSLTFNLFNRIWISYENSITRKVIQAVLKLWDKAVEGSLVIGFLTGEDLRLRKITEKPSFFGQSIYSRWSGLLLKIDKIGNDNPSFVQSKFLGNIKIFAELFIARPLWSIGWIGLAFLPILGSLRLLTYGLSLTDVIVILFSIIFCVLLTFSNITLPQIIDGSVFVKLLDGCDE